MATSRFRLGGLAIMFGLAAAPAFAADEPIYAAENPIVRALLPYAPYAFDLSLQVARSFAEIGYDQRSYDPITGDFVVSGLRIKRDIVDVTIDRLRIGENTVQAQGVAMDTRGLPLPPEMREALQSLNRETVTADFAGMLRRDDTRSAMALDMSIDLDGMGALNLQAAVDKFHILVPLPETFPDNQAGFPDGDASQPTPPPQFSGELRDGSLVYRDRGLIKAAAAIAAKQQGVPPEQFLQGVASVPLMSVNQMLDGLPGGASPALRTEATLWAQALQTFLTSPDAIRISFNPAQPLPLARFESGVIDEPLIAALNPTVAIGPAAIAPAVARSDTPLLAAQSLLSGRATLQNPEEGARSLIALAKAGDIEAAKQLAAALAAGPLPALDAAERQELIAYLLVARALGEPVSDPLLGRVGQGLDSAGIRDGEITAAVYFKQNTPNGAGKAAVSPESVKSFDPAQLRKMAFDAYEGMTVTRDLTEAYGLALVASAAGDPIAATLRDRLADALGQERVVIEVDDARARADALWAAYSTR